MLWRSSRRTQSLLPSELQGILFSLLFSLDSRGNTAACPGPGGFNLPDLVHSPNMLRKRPEKNPITIIAYEFLREPI